MGMCLALPGTPSQEYVPVRTGRNHAVPLLLLRIILLPSPSCSKALSSTSLWEKGMLLWQGFNLSSHQHSHPGAAQH